MDKFEVSSFVFCWKFLYVSSKGGKIQFVPGLVGPGVLCLKVVSQVSAVDVESEVSIKVSVVSDSID